MSSPTITGSAGVKNGPERKRPGFAEAARPHLSGLYSLARCLAGDPNTAEDLVRRCLLTAYHAYGGQPDIEALPAALKQTLIVCVREDWQAHSQGWREPSLVESRHVVAEAGNAGPAAALRKPVPGLLSTVEMDDLLAVLARLATIYRVPLVLVQMEGYTTEEVADLLDTAPDIVRSRLDEVREQFKRQLWDYALEQELLIE